MAWIEDNGSINRISLREAWTTRTSPEMLLMMIPSALISSGLLDNTVTAYSFDPSGRMAAVVKCSLTFPVVRSRINEVSNFCLSVSDNVHFVEHPMESIVPSE